jgi:hypothetical protein
LEKTRISWTIGPSDNFRDEREDSGRVDINFETGEGEEVTDYTLYYIIGGIVVGLIGIAFLVRYLLKRRSKLFTE